MVLEVADIEVSDAEAFERAYLEARHLLITTPGCHTVRMTHGIEDPHRFVLLVEWDSVESHEQNFRQTDRFTQWRAAIGPWFARPPRVEHFRDVGYP